MKMCVLSCMFWLITDVCMLFVNLHIKKLHVVQEFIYCKFDILSKQFKRLCINLMSFSYTKPQHIACMLFCRKKSLTIDIYNAVMVILAKTGTKEDCMDTLSICLQILLLKLNVVFLQESIISFFIVRFVLCCLKNIFFSIYLCIDFISEIIFHPSVYTFFCWN